MKLLDHVRELRERRRPVGPPAPGQVLPGPHGALHGHVAGPVESNAPLVVLEAGLGCPSAAWAWVQRTLAQRGVPSVTVDRPGIGWSAPSSSGAPTAEEHVRNVESVLNHLDHRGPVWLVGHSVGGLLIRSMAARWPDRTRGLTFVDSTHPDQLRSGSQREAVLRHKHALQIMLRRSRSRGQPNNHESLDGSPLGRLPAPLGEQILKISSARTHLLTSLAELECWPSWADDAARLDHVDIPVRVISASQTTGPDPVQLRLHEELASLSDDSHHHVVEDSDHQSVIMDPRYAAATAETVMFSTESSALSQASAVLT